MLNAKTILSMLLILSLTISACSDDDDDNGELDIGEFPLEGLLNMNISSLSVSVEEWDGEFEAFVDMTIVENHQTASLRINGNNVPLFREDNFYYGFLDMMPGQSFSYELRIDNKTRSGSLSIPALVRGNFPADFDLSSNYTMSWTSSADPTGFIAALIIELDDDDISNFELLPGSARNHTFNRSIYSGLSEDDLLYIDAGVLSINYEVRDNMVILAVQRAFEEYDYYGDFFFRQADGQIDADRPRGIFPHAKRRMSVPVE